MKETKFKETEVGLVPVDWEVKKLGEIGAFSKGMGISRAESNTGSIPAIRYGEIYTSHNDYIKAFYSHISEEVASRSKRLKCGDILFTASGETKEDIAKAVAFIDDIEAYASGDIIVLSPKTQVDSKCLGFLLNTEYVIKQRASKAQGDAIVHITTKSIESIAVSLPPLSEQRRIASALSNIDDLISNLDTLIEKKRNIKQGAMQQLLTGKTRLKGFTEPWVEKKLGEVEIRNGSMLKSSEYKDGVIPVIAGGKTPSGFHSEYNREKDTITISGSGANAGYIAFYHEPIFASDCSTINKQEGFDIKYMYYSLLSKQTAVYKCQAGGAQPHIHAKDICDITILLPTDISEQHAIASILTKMDDEIAALEQRREKYAALKQGMMQQLLTGKIRLVD